MLQQGVERFDDDGEEHGRYHVALTKPAVVIHWWALLAIDDDARVDPSQITAPTKYKSKSSWPNQTDRSERNTSYNNHA